MAGTAAPTAAASGTASGVQEQPPPPPRPRKVIYSLPLASAASEPASSSPAVPVAAAPTGHRLGVNALAAAPWVWSSTDPSTPPSLSQTLSAANGGMLLSAGRDGAIIGWDLRPSSSPAPATTTAATSPLMVLRGHLDWVNDILVPDQLHSPSPSPSGWAPSFVSASNDRSVRLWRVHPNPNSVSPHPLSATGAILGHHNDYVKCLGYAYAPRFIVSGGLDQRIGIWDLGSETRGNIGWLTVSDSSPKQSVYTVSTHPAGSLIVSGSPDKLIRLWDPRSLRKVGQLVGHTDHVRSVVLSPDAHSVLSASSDGTVKLWSLHTNRCIATYTHHSDSVWTLSPTFSSSPGRGSFSGFYSAGRDGSVYRTEFVHPMSGVTPSSAATMSMLTATAATTAKSHATSTSFATSSASMIAEEEPASRTLLLFRDTAPKSESSSQKLSSTNGASVNGQSQQQPRGIHHLVAHNGVVYTATINSTILGWMDARPEDWEQVNGLFMPGGDGNEDDDDNADLDLLHPPDANGGLSPNKCGATSTFIHGAPLTWADAPLHSEPFPMLDQDTAESDLSLGGPTGPMLPLRTSPIVELQGHHGLIKHSLLSNKRHVLTQDTAGNVELWDIVRCQRVQSFGKGVDFDVIRSEINVPEYNVNWCSVDTRIGTLSVQLTEQRCFDAEMYLDESGVDGIEYLADQRTNIGRWVLISLFRHFVAHMRAPPSPPPIHSSLSLTNGTTSGTQDQDDGASDTKSDDSLPLVPPVPPVPAEAPATPKVSERTLQQDYNQPPAADTSSAPPQHDRNVSAASASASTSTDDDDNDRGRSPSRSATPASTSSSQAPTSGDASDASPRPRSRSRSIVSRLRRISLKKLGVGDDSDGDAKKEKEKDKDKKSKSAPTSPVISRGVVRSPSIPLVQGKLPSFAAAAAAAAKSAMSSKPAAAAATGTAQQTVTTAVAVPGMPAPVPIPNDTVVAIMEEEPGACSPFARWIGTVGTTALHPTGLQSSLPAWLEDLLLRDVAPTKEPVKIGFQLTAQPGSGLPELRSGNQRLLANRLVRVRRILAYIAENAGILVPEGKAVEEQIELVIAGQPVNPMLTLATVKTYVWRAGGDGDLSATYRLRTTLVGPTTGAAGQQPQGETTPSVQVR